MARKRRRYSRQNLSHYKLGSYRMGKLYPISVTEVLPGDIFRHSTSLFMRLSPLVTPVMHPVHVRLFHFYVPLRLIWEDFEEFRTGGEDGLASPELPFFTVLGDAPAGSLIDHMGIPPMNYPEPGLDVSVLPFRAYYLIWNEWFRNQDTDEPVTVNLTSGRDPSDQSLHGIMPYAWGKDYFTTASLTPQRGPEVTIPVNSPGDRTLKIVPGSDNTPFSLRFQTSTQGSGTPDGVVDLPTKNTAGSQPGLLDTWPANPALRWDYTNSNDSGYPDLVGGQVFWPKDTGLEVDVSSASGDLGSISIADWREAMALQRFEEHRALYGSRYTEYLRSLGIRASDARLQRPEYLGGSRETIQFSEVLQTAADGDTPVGTLRGHGVAATKTATYRRFFEEDGFVMTLMAVEPISVYMQGVDKMFLRKTKEDFWTPEFQHLSQQPVYTRELYAAADKDEVFGYQDIYDEYRYHRSSVSGEMQTVLKDWHFARDFANKPDLNSQFIYGAPTVRPFASQDTDTLYVMSHHTIHAKRLMSKRGTPR